MKALIVAYGGKNSGSVSGKTAFLLAGEKAGPEKLKKAESLGIKIISETDFRAMLPNDDGQSSSETAQIEEQTELTLF